jgi:MoxR-like ATPase
VIGKEETVRLSLVCLLADGHLLLDDKPGVGKTRLAGGIAEAFNGTCHRVQGTADLLPSDITGSMVIRRNTDGANPGDRSDGFVLREGPVFANVLLCDEINRTPPRTQAALLEAMEERQVTVFDETRVLPDPFFVIATQNPVEMDGTYPLPAAQLDRFLMRLSIGYPSTESFEDVLRQFGGRRRDAVGTGRGDDLGPAEIVEMIAHVDAIHVGQPVYRYIAELVEATRDRGRVLLGASPRAGIALLRAARAAAAVEGSDTVRLDHVQNLAPHVLGHRIVLREPSSDSETEHQLGFVRQVLREVATPKRVAA